MGDNKNGSPTHLTSGLSCGNYTRVNSTTRPVLWLSDRRYGCMHAGGGGGGGVVPTSQRTRVNFAFLAPL